MEMNNIELLRAVDLWLLPCCFACFALLVRLRLLSANALWPSAKLVSAIGLGFSIVALFSTFIYGVDILSAAPILDLGKWGSISFSARADLLGALFLVMVNLIGWIITGFSHHYLAGEQNQTRYVGSLFMVLAAVNVVVIANNMVILALAWTVTSLSLHALLTFYPSRAQAVFAAHKKFLISRLADVCLFGAIGLIAYHTGSLELNQVSLRLSELSSLPNQLQLAAFLLAVTAALKCAQLPFHGWLIQVMEAPTPVSALLHAGIVNLGGFLLIRFAILIDLSGVAQIFLVVIGSVTTAIAAMVMMTRISIKVSLAWSTSAQMGFMLIQCGLGAYELAALHLLAHSLYKAHSFLNSGNTNAALTLRIGATRQLGLPQRLASGCLGLIVVFALFKLAQQPISPDQPLFAFAVIIALALAPLLSFQFNQRGVFDNVRFLLYSAALILLYLGLHQVFADYVDASENRQGSWVEGLVVWVCAVFVALYLLQSIVLEKPKHIISRTLYPYFYGGFFLDDLFTRLTFKLWPVKSSPNKLPLPSMLAQPQPVQE